MPTNDRFVSHFSDFQLIQAADAPLGILELLRLRGYPHQANAKYVRHKDPKLDIEELLSAGELPTYQSIQEKPIFDGLDYIISFVGEEGTRARFIGVYKVGKRTDFTPSLINQCKQLMASGFSGKVHYELTPQAQYQVFHNRLVIEWGKAALAWHQRVDKDRTVLEIRADGRALPEFNDYLDFTLSHSDLALLRQTPKAHRDWISRLSCVSGIYLILDTRSGRHYVGSAYGTEGVWGRWRQYAENGHGGNKHLIELCQNTDLYPKSFRYSLLQVLPLSTTAKRVIELEHRYMTKLGSRTTGLNWEPPSPPALNSR